MPDETLVEAKAEIQEAKADIAEAKADVKEAPDDNQAASRLERAEARLEAAEKGLAELYQKVEGAAKADHSHPHSPHLTALEEHLAAMEREEQEVKRLPWYKRKIGRR